VDVSGMCRIASEGSSEFQNFGASRVLDKQEGSISHWFSCAESEGIEVAAMLTWLAKTWFGFGV
jgi:hypothetical protein